MAKQEAQTQAEITAKSLGVHLGAIIQYSEDGGGYSPVFYKADYTGPQAAGSVTLPQGQNEITSRVTITYLIK